MIEDDDDLSTVTITGDHTSYLNSSPSKMSPPIKTGENDAFMREPKIGTISRKELLIQMDEFKFAEMAKAVKDTALLDDEASPSDSLVSSTTSSDDCGLKKKKEEDMKSSTDQEYSLNEKNLEDITPELVDMISPVTPGTPTHASNSLSLSDGGRDFLIDDEIADQPALVFDDNQNNASQSEYFSNILNAASEATTTPTLRDISIDSRGSLKSSKRNSFFNNLQNSPLAVKTKKLTRTESLDTLSPCDSIASDDLMADFDLNSSLDSIDR